MYTRKEVLTPKFFCKKNKKETKDIAPISTKGDMAGVEKLASSGFAKTAYLIGELVSDAAGRDELCETIIKEHGLALCPAATAPPRGPAAPGTPAATDAKAKSEAPTPLAEGDTSVVIAKMAGWQTPRARGFCAPACPAVRKHGWAVCAVGSRGLGVARLAWPAPHHGGGAQCAGVSFLAPRGKFDVEFRQSSLSFIDKNGALVASCPVANIAVGLARLAACCTVFGHC